MNSLGTVLFFLDVFVVGAEDGGGGFDEVFAAVVPQPFRVHQIVTGVDDAEIFAILRWQSENESIGGVDELRAAVSIAA